MQIKTIIVSCHTADSKPVKQEVDGTVIIPPLVFPVRAFESDYKVRSTTKTRAYFVIYPFFVDYVFVIFIVQAPTAYEGEGYFLTPLPPIYPVGRVPFS